MLGRTRVALLAIVVAGTVVGCGDDGGDGDAPSAKAQPRASGDGSSDDGSAERFVRRLGETLRKTKALGRCDEIDAINERSVYDFSCPLPPKARESMASFEVVEGEAFGTGAVVAYRSGEAPKGATIVLSRDPSGQWGVTRFGLLTSAGVGTGDERSRAGFAEAVNGYLGAVREGDCRVYADYAATSSPSSKRACDEEFPQTTQLADLLKRNPGAEPSYLGGNSAFGFFGLRLDDPEPRHLTIAVMKTPKGAERPYLVLNVVAGPV